MGTGIYPRGESWYIDFWIKGERYIECLGKVSKTFAKEEAARRRTALLEGRLRPRVKDPPFQKFIDRYLKDVSANKASRSEARDKTSAPHLKRFFGGKRVSQINRMDIERYKRLRREEIQGVKGIGAPLVSINRELALLSHAFNLAKLPNPVKGVKRFEEFGRERFLDKDEETRIFQAIRNICPKLEPLFLILINAGYRLGEVLSLVNDPEMVNFKEGYIKIPRTLRKGKKKDVLTPLNDTLTNALKDALRIRDVERGQRIFPYSIQYVNKIWRRVRKAAGLNGVRIHDLRHTFGSRAGKEAWDDPYAVQELMGHTDFRTTQKYIHVSEARKRAIMDRLDQSPNIFLNIKRKGLSSI